MLQDVLETIHNYFVRDTQSGTYTISDGAISPVPVLKEGQRFLITGSDLNDGVYTYHESMLMNDDDCAGAGLADEVFSGAICGLSVPPQVIALSAEISEWVDQYGAAVTSPYQSESFGGYSYTRASASKKDGSGGAAGWQDVFGSRLKRWRKVAF